MSKSINVALHIGKVEAPQTVIDINVANNEEATQEIRAQVQQNTGEQPNSDSVYVFCAGIEEDDFTELIEEVGFFGEPTCFPGDNGVWAKLQLGPVLEMIGQPPLAENPLIKQAIAGTAAFEFSVQSDKSLADALALKEARDISGLWTLLSSLAVKIQAQGDQEAIQNALGIAKQVVPGVDDASLLVTHGLLNKFNFEAKFDSWEDLDEETQNRLLKAKDLGVEKSLKGGIAGMLAAFGALVANEISAYLVVNDSQSIRAQVKVPGIVEYAGALAN